MSATECVVLEPDALLGSRHSAWWDAQSDEDRQDCALKVRCWRRCETAVCIAARK